MLCACTCLGWRSWHDGVYLGMQVEWKCFTMLRQQVASEWAALPKQAQVVSAPLAEKVAAVRRAKGL